MELKRLIIFILIIILLGLLNIFFNPKLTGEFVKEEEYEREAIFVDRVIDGDTIVCDNGTIRFLGVNTMRLEFIG